MDVGAIAFVMLFVGICYIGFLINRKPQETFTAYLSNVAGKTIPPSFFDDLAALNRGETRRKI